LRGFRDKLLEVVIQLCRGPANWLPFVDKVNARPNAKEVFRAILEDPIDFESDPWDRLSKDCKDLVRRTMERDPEVGPLQMPRGTRHRMWMPVPRHVIGCGCQFLATSYADAGCSPRHRMRMPCTCHIIRY